MNEIKVVKGVCKKTGQYFALEVKQFGAEWKVVNMTHMTADAAKVVASEVEQKRFETADNLLACSGCGSRRVGGCSCASKKCALQSGAAYNFQCIYCKKFELDFSVPDASALSGAAGKKITLPQGKVVEITFSNVNWEMFDNIQYHPSGREYNEPAIHVVAKKKNIEFHGYNISEMDEGVYYDIGGADYFEIECDVNTTTIKPHPGGSFYVKMGLITASITQEGGKFYLGGKSVAAVGSKFKMRLSYSKGVYEIHIDGKKKGELGDQKLSDTVRVIFGFKHESHHCSLLSHAYITDIAMKQRVGQ